MPAEADRLQRRIGRRDRRVIAFIAIAGVAAVAAAPFVSGQARGAGSDRCVSFDRAGVMGGGTWHLCGAAALTFCRQQAAQHIDVSDRCAAIRRSATKETDGVTKLGTDLGR